MADIIKDQVRICNVFKKTRTLALFAHMFPDGDALGSMVALGLILKKMGKKVSLFCPSDLPKRYNFLPLYREISLRPKKRVIYDAAVALDCASSVQLGGLFESVFRRAKKTIVIDHHSFRKEFSDVALIEPKSAAVGEMVFDLLKFLPVKLDKEIAQALLVSVIVETGSFRLPSVTPHTFRICADLIGAGIDYYGIVEKSYWSRSKAEAAALGLCYSRVRFYKGDRLAVTYVTAADMSRLKAMDEDVDPIADQIRMLKGVRVVLLFRDMPGDFWRVSLRSKGDLNIGQVAERFGGGGHQDVAGCYLKKSRSSKQALISHIKRLL